VGGQSGGDQRVNGIDKEDFFQLRFFNPRAEARGLAG
jgi:hypothetical protein